MTASEETIALARTLARAACDKQATSGSCIDVSEQLVLVELFVILSASSERQMKALVNAVDEAAHEVRVKLKHREGMGEQMRWVLLDYGDVIVHIFHDEERDLYSLEKLWGDCPVIDLECDFSGGGDPQANPLVSYALSDNGA